MRAVRRIIEWSPARVALAAILAAAVWVSTTVATTAAASPTLHLTYITGLGTSRPQAVISGIDGNAPVQLGLATSALLSPDGSHVATIYTAASSTLKVYSAAGGVADVLKTSAPFMQLLAWSPDSNLLLVAVGGTTPRGQLIVFNLAAATSTVVATGVFKGANFAPGTTNAIVYALANASGSAVNLYVTTPSGAPTRQLTHDNRSEFPVWGPGGIVFSRMIVDSKGQASPWLQLWFIRAGGAGLRQLTNVNVHAPAKSTGLTPIAFSANGKHLLANLVGPNLNWHEAYVLDLSGPKVAVRDLTGQGNGTTTGDAISTDGTQILATKGSSSDQAGLSIEEIKWDGGKATVVAKNGAYASWNW
jgi:hypothetical protein